MHSFKIVTRFTQFIQVVLGALQTLSLTRHVQSLLLRTSDTITWLLNLLTDPDDLSEFICNIGIG